MFVDLFFIIAIYFLVYITWIGYIAAMQLRQRLDELHPVAKAHAYVFGIVFVLFDFIVNMTFGTMIFLDIPREFMLTQRLKRMKQEGADWQASTASWICTHLLNQFDPTGDHC